MTTSPSPFAYEFRFFAPSLSEELEALSEYGVSSDPADSSETYLVSRLTIEASVKIRAGRLQIKELTERVGLLEGWVRALELDLPVMGEVFLTEAAARLGVALDIDKEALLSETDMLRLAKSHHSLRPVQVTKRRTIFDLDACRGELASIAFGGHVADTIAIEGHEASAVLGKVEQLGFLDRTNESYPCYLQRFVFYEDRAVPSHHA